MKNTPTEAFRAYCAGFLDGEGCVSIKKMTRKRVNKNGTVKEYMSTTLVVDLAQNKKTVLELIQSIYGGSIYKYESPRPNSSSSYILRLNQKNAEYFLNQIKDYCVVKKENVDLAIDYCQFKSLQSEKTHFKSCKNSWQRTPEYIEKELWYVSQSKALNKRGKLNGSSNSIFR